MRPKMKSFDKITAIEKYCINYILWNYLIIVSYIFIKLSIIDAPIATIRNKFLYLALPAFGASRFLPCSSATRLALPIVLIWCRCKLIVYMCKMINKLIQCYDVVISYIYSFNNLNKLIYNCVFINFNLKLTLWLMIFDIEFFYLIINLINLKVILRVDLW